MSRPERFRFRTLEELFAKARELGLELPISGNIGILLSPFALSGRTLPNRLAIHPMEGADADARGGPGELTFRRYGRFGAGGCSLIWFEAAAVVPAGRSNPRQLLLDPRNLDGFKRLVAATRKAAAREGGAGRDLLLVLQLTHSGRFSKPEGKPAPIIAHHAPLLDAVHDLPHDSPLIEDDDLDRLQDDFVKAAGLASEAGFDGVDIKACHGYLVAELLGAVARKGRYGGSFENRTRFLRETLHRVRDRFPGLIAAVRLNATDTLPYPQGFGADRNKPGIEDLSEPRALLRALSDDGVALVNITVGVPHLRPHFGRPFDKPIRGGAVPDEHPLEGVARLVRITAELQSARPSLPLVGTGYSWLRQYAPAVAAGVLTRKKAALIGFGRMAFAYPDFARDLLLYGRLDPNKVCVACSGCSDLPRAGLPAGCIVRDRPTYRKAPGLPWKGTL